MAPKAASKKTPAVLAAEASADWAAQESEWFRARIVLERTLQAARAHLATEIERRNQLADQIEFEAGRRESVSAQYEIQRARAAGASSELKQRLQAIDERLQLQTQLMVDTAEEKQMLSCQIQKVRANAQNGTPSIVDTAETVETLTQRWRSRIVIYRRAEIRALALEMRLRRVSKAALQHAAPLPLRMGKHHLVFFGPKAGGPVSRLLRATYAHKPHHGVIVSQVLAASDQDVDRLGTTECLNNPNAGRHCTFVTSIGPMHTSPAQHVAAVLDAFRDLPSHQTAIIFVVGVLQDPMRPSYLTLDCGVTVDTADLLALSEDHSNVVVVLDCASKNAFQRGWSALSVGSTVGKWRHRLGIEADGVAGMQSTCEEGPLALLLANLLVAQQYPAGPSLNALFDAVDCQPTFEPLSG